MLEATILDQVRSIFQPLEAREMLIEKTDLEEETVDEVLRILKSEFEEGEN